MIQVSNEHYLFSLSPPCLRLFVVLIGQLVDVVVLPRCADSLLSACPGCVQQKNGLITTATPPSEKIYLQASHSRSRSTASPIVVQAAAFLHILAQWSKKFIIFFLSPSPSSLSLSSALFVAAAAAVDATIGNHNAVEVTTKRSDHIYLTILDHKEGNPRNNAFVIVRRRTCQVFSERTAMDLPGTDHRGTHRTYLRHVVQKCKDTSDETDAVMGWHRRVDSYNNRSSTLPNGSCGIRRRSQPWDATQRKVCFTERKGRDRKSIGRNNHQGSISWFRLAMHIVILM